MPTGVSDPLEWKLKVVVGHLAGNQARVHCKSPVEDLETVRGLIYHSQMCIGDPRPPIAVNPRGLLVA